MHRNQSDSQIARKEGLRNDSYADPPSRPQRKHMFRDRYEEGEQDEVHVSRPKIRDRRKVVEYEYAEEDEKPRAQGKRTGKIKPSKPVEDDVEEESEEVEEEREEPTARGRKVTEHSEHEDAEPKAKNRYTNSSLALTDWVDGEQQHSDAKQSRLTARSATKPYPGAPHHADHADTLAPQAHVTKSRRNEREVYEDEDEE